MKQLNNLLEVQRDYDITLKQTKTGVEWTYKDKEYLVSTEPLGYLKRRNIDMYLVVAYMILKGNNITTLNQAKHLEVIFNKEVILK